MLNDDLQSAAGEDQLWWAPVPSRQGARPAHLTSRERQVLALICEGLSNNAIARRLGIAPTTVKVHVSKILRMLNVTNRLNAVLRIRSWGLIERPVDHEERAQPTVHARQR